MIFLIHVSAVCLPVAVVDSVTGNDTYSNVTGEMSVSLMCGDSVIITGNDVFLCEVK